jgi:hypothetical protein
MLGFIQKPYPHQKFLENYKSTRSRFGNDGYVTSGLVLYLDVWKY